MKLAIICIEIAPQEGGWAVVLFDVSSLDPVIYASNTISLQVPNGSAFEVGKQYDLSLEEIR